jgi:hypothetical protein
MDAPVTVIAVFIPGSKDVTNVSYHSGWFYFSVVKYLAGGAAGSPSAGIPDICSGIGSATWRCGWFRLR